MAMIDCQEVNPELEELGRAEARWRLAGGKFGAQKTPIVIVFLVMLTICQSASAADSERPIEVAKVLAIKDAPKAYAAYIDLFLIIQPHPDHEIEKTIVDAQEGDADAFAFFSFLVWRGYGGIVEDKLSGKLGLIRAENDGSAQAPYHIATTFLQSPADTDEEKLDNAVAGLHWLGVAAAMGDEMSHDRAMKYIRESAKGDEEIENALTRHYNNGLAAGAESSNNPGP